MTWYITTDPAGSTCYARRLDAQRASLVEIVTEGGVSHRLVSRDEAARLYERPVLATADEAKAADEALEMWRWRQAWAQREAATRPVSGWHETEHQGRRWWGRQLAGGEVELVSPAGDASMVTTRELIAGRAVDAKLALAALRMSRLLGRVPKLVVAKQATKQVAKIEPIGGGKSAVEMSQERLKDLKRRGLISRYASL